MKFGLVRLWVTKGLRLYLYDLEVRLMKTLSQPTWYMWRQVSSTDLSESDRQRHGRQISK